MAMLALLFVILLMLSYRFRRIFYSSPMNNVFNDSVEASQRRAALNEAKIFLAPYSDIWRDLRLSNKYVSLILGHDGVTIKCIEKVKPYRKFQITESQIHTYQELWNMFCIFFSYNKSYNGVIEDCQKFHVSIIESGEVSKTHSITPYNAPVNKNKQKEEPNETLYEKLDINNCSEVELTALPGISIVIAKKVIKRRDEIGGFKSVEDFFKFVKLKPHMQNQLHHRIKVEKMKGHLYSKKYEERSVDF